MKINLFIAFAVRCRAVVPFHCFSTQYEVSVSKYTATNAQTCEHTKRGSHGGESILLLIYFHFSIY